MTLDKLRVTLATTLNKNIDIPLIDEKWEQVFFERLIDRIWPMVPQQVKWAIQTAGSVIEPAYVEAITQSLRLSILPVISSLFWWRDDHLKIADTITAHLMAMTPENSTAENYTPPEAIVHEHANEVAPDSSPQPTADSPTVPSDSLPAA